MALAPEMLPFEPVVVSVLDVRLPMITTSPVTLPPTFAFSELLARMNAALAVLNAGCICGNTLLAAAKEAFAWLNAAFA